MGSEVSHRWWCYCIGGIYPVFDHSTYPGLSRAAPAYGLTEKQLQAQQNQLNPIKRAAELAAAKIPVFIIHGIDDKVVPLAANSAALEKTYSENGAADLIEVIKVPGQGHNHWPGFFNNQGLADTVQLVRSSDSAVLQTLVVEAGQPT